MKRSSGARGDQDIGDFASFSFDEAFRIGTPFEVTLQLINGTAIAGVADGPSYAHVDLTLSNTGLEVFDPNNGDAFVPGSFITLSGHDYTMAPVPEPSACLFVPALAAGGLVLWRSRRTERRGGLS